MSIIKYSDIDIKKIQYNQPEKQGGHYYKKTLFMA